MSTDTITDDIPDVATATTDFTTAQAEADQAEQHADSLEDRVLTGDPAVTADDLTAAEGLSRFARLRRDAAKARLDRAKAAERARRIDALNVAARAYADTHGRDGRTVVDAALQKLNDTVTKAVTEFLAVEAQRDAAFNALLTEALDLGFAQAGHTGRVPAQPYIGPGGQGLNLTTDLAVRRNRWDAPHGIAAASSTIKQTLVSLQDEESRR